MSPSASWAKWVIPTRTEPSALAGAADPLVLAGVLQVVGVHGDLLAVGGRSVRCAAGYWPVPGSANSGRDGLAHALDVDRLELLDLDRRRRRPRAVSIGPAGEGQRRAQGVRVADHVDDVRRLEQLAVELDPADGVLERASARPPGPAPLNCIASAPAVRSSWTVSSSEPTSTGPVGLGDGDPDARAR